MSRRSKIISIIGVVIICVFGAALFWQWPNNKRVITLDPNNSDLVALGKKVYVKYCAVCHGKNLEGQPNWRQRLPNGRMLAPPHDKSGHTWHHPDEQLFKITKFGPASLLPDGKYQSDMPGFQRMLSDEEILAVLSYIKSTWPKAVQQRHNEINGRVPR